MDTADLRMLMHRVIRKHCLSLPASISTKEILEHLKVTQSAETMQLIGARGRILMDLAKFELADCATQGDPEPGPYGEIIRRWRWHAPVAGRSPGTKPAKVPPQPKTETVSWSGRIEAKLFQLGVKLDTLIRLMENNR